MDDQRLRELLKKAKDSDLGWKALQAKEVIECLVGLEWYLAAAGPVGGAGELLAAKAPQGVPASKPVLLDYADYAKRASGLAEQFEKMFTTMSPPPRDEVRRQLYDLFVEIDRGIWESVAGRLTASPVHIEPNPSTCTCIIGYRTSPSPITAVGQCIVHGNDAVPAPVSDDTIHHGMVPPATVFKTTVLGVGPWCVEFPDGEIISTRSEARARLIAEREAAAPKPAPPTFTESQVTSRDEVQSEDGSRSLGKEVPAPHSSVAATPAPGAEPLHSLLPGTPVGEALRLLEHEVAVHILSESPAQEFMDDIRLLCRTLREALAAAPPAPTFGPGNYSCAVCGLGMVEPCEHWKAASNTSHVETEGESGRQPEVCHSPSAEEQEWLNAPMGDRHASAERVRQLVEGWRKYAASEFNYGSSIETRAIEGAWRIKAKECADELERVLPPSTGEKLPQAKANEK